MSCHAVLKRAARTCVATALAATLATPALAVPPPITESVAEVAPGSTHASVSTTAGATITLETSSSAIAASAPFSFGARVSLSRPARSVRIRLRVFRPTGRLIYQRTRTFSGDDLKSAKVAFGRETADIGMPPDLYPVELETVIVRKNSTHTAKVATGLIVYDATAARVGVVAVARVVGAPLADPLGRMAFDPGRYSRTRDDVTELCTWVLSDPRARLTLSVPPMLLEEWRRIAQGYELAGPEGVESISAQTPIARSYAAALDLVSRALSTGRLELCAAGYSDPDLSDLDRHGMGSDTAAQYRRGVSATYAALETTPSTGTVPAGGSLPETAFDLLVGQDVSYAVVDPRWTRRNDTTASPGAYRDTTGRVVLVTDSEASRSAAESDPVLALTPARTRNSAGSRAPIVVLCEIGQGRADSASLVASARYLYSLPWTTPRLGREAAGRASKRSVRLKARPRSKAQPADYWSRVSDARRCAKALSAALGADSAEALDTQDTSLISQSAAWAGADRNWALAERGRAYADHAARVCNGILGAVRLRVQPVTLSGSVGHVPVTIINSSKKTLRLSVTTLTQGGISVGPRKDPTIEVRPKESFLEIPVDLHNAIQGKLTVRAEAGPLTVDSAQVTVSASYIDRVVTIVAVVLLLGILLALIVRRVRPTLGKDVT